MNFDSQDVIGLVAVIMVFSIVLVPVIGLTARFALKPTVEALSQFFSKKGDQETVVLLERRMALMEQQLEAMEVNLRSLDEAQRFDQRLRAGGREAPRSGSVEE